MHEILSCFFITFAIRYSIQAPKTYKCPIAAPKYPNIWFIFKALLLSPGPISHRGLYISYIFFPISNPNWGFFVCNTFHIVPTISGFFVELYLMTPIMPQISLCSSSARTTLQPSSSVYIQWKNSSSLARMWFSFQFFSTNCIMAGISSIPAFRAMMLSLICHSSTHYY